MTVASTESRISSSGNGTTVAFSFPYLFLAKADLKVILKTNATEVEVVQVLDSDYTVTGEGNDGGGTVTMTVAPPIGTTLIRFRDQADIQGLDLVENDPFPADQVEAAFDRSMLSTQQIRDRVDRAIRLSDGSEELDLVLPDIATRGGKTLAFDANGNVIAGVSNTLLATLLTTALTSLTLAATAVVASISAMTALDSSDLVGGEVIMVTDVSRGGTFVVRAGSTTQDEGTLFNPDDAGAFHFQRQYDGPFVHVVWFDAAGGSKATAPGSLTDELTAIQNATDNFLKVRFDGDKRYRADGTITVRTGTVWQFAGGDMCEVVTTNTTLPLLQAANAGTGRTTDINIDGFAFFATTSFTGTRLIDFRGVSRQYWNCRISADVATINGPLASTTMMDSTVGFGDPFGDSVNAFNVHNTWGPKTNIRGGKWNLNAQGNIFLFDKVILARGTEYGFRTDLLQDALFLASDVSNNGLAGGRIINTVDGFVRGINIISPYHEGNEDRTAGQFSPNDWDIDAELLGEVYIGRGRTQNPINIGSYWHGSPGLQNADTSEVLTGSGRAATYNILENSDFAMVDAASTPANVPFGWPYSNGGGSNGTFTALASGLPDGIASGIQISHSGSGAYSLEQTISVVEGEIISIVGGMWADGNVTDVRFGIKPVGGTNQLFSFEIPDTDSTWYFGKVQYVVEAGVTQIEIGLSGFTGAASSIVKLCALNATRSAQNFADRNKPLTDAGGNVYGPLIITDGQFILPLATTVQLDDIAHVVNTGAAKRIGSYYYNTTTKKTVTANGGADGDVWVDATGTTAHTPA